LSCIKKSEGIEKISEHIRIKITRKFKDGRKSNEEIFDLNETGWMAIDQRIRDYISSKLTSYITVRCLD